MIVTGKFTDLLLNSDYKHADLLGDYHGEFESLEHLVDSLKTKYLVIGEFDCKADGRIATIYTVSQTPYVYKHLQYYFMSADKETRFFENRNVLLNLKETIDDKGRRYWYILDAMVMK